MEMGTTALYTFHYKYSWVETINTVGILYIIRGEKFHIFADYFTTV